MPRVAGRPGPPPPPRPRGGTRGPGSRACTRGATRVSAPPPAWSRRPPGRARPPPRSVSCSSPPPGETTVERPAVAGEEEAPVRVVRRHRGRVAGIGQIAGLEEHADPGRLVLEAGLEVDEGVGGVARVVLAVHEVARGHDVEPGGH